MDTTKKIGSEITVRISLTFQDAPDVHTLLAMTPVRQRGKLVRLALERYIVETSHVSGNVDIQIEAISSWLKRRNNHTSVKSTSQEKFEPKKTHAFNDVQKNHLAEHEVVIDINNRAEKISSDKENKSERQVNIVDSASMQRWLRS